MRNISKFLLVVCSITLLFLNSGCSVILNASIQDSDPLPSLVPPEITTMTATPFQALTNTPIIIPPTYTPSYTFTPSATFTPLPTDTPIPTDTPVPTETPGLVWNPAGQVTAPILLYHHISDVNAGNRYYVPVANFRAQMETLRDWGYHTITVSKLVEVLFNGGELPQRPVIITFDDGNFDVYQNAFPIMHEMGFVGVFYIVANRVQSNNYVNAGQLQEMADAGWEIGNHGMTHADLTLDTSNVYYEMVESRAILQGATGLPIDSFAYAYGKTNDFISNKASEYGYHAAMGLGLSTEHTLNTLFYLTRIEVQSDYSLSTFGHYLPWSDQ